MANPSHSPELPRRYGKYELLERIGVGGMAEVYRARLPGIAGFEKAVVIKRLHPKFAHDPAFVDMFVEEAKLAAQVQHKNVVQVFELGCLDERDLFMAMEYVPGVDLKHLIWGARYLGKRVPVWFSVHVLVEVLEGLAFAYDLEDAAGRRRNIVHCDVTPENIFVSRAGDIKLGDFGVALDDTRANDPFAGQIKGKVPYLAPEQIAGERATAASDVFAAAVVLWESLTHRRLFSGSTPQEVMARICAAPRPPPSRYNPEVSPQLDAFVLRALDPDRRQRPSSARELQEQLLEVQSELGPRVTLGTVRDVLEAMVGPPGQELPWVEVRAKAAEAEAVEAEDDSAFDDDETETEVASRPQPAAAPVANAEDDDPYTYAIIKPKRATEDIPDLPRIPMPGGPAKVETNDVVRRGKPELSAPIAAPASLVETGDLLPLRTRTGPHRWTRGIGALAPAETSVFAPGSGADAQGSTPFDGPHPLYVRRSGEEVGPLSLADAATHLRSLPAHALSGVMISPNRLGWSTAFRLFQTLGEELLPSEGVLPHCEFSGTLKGHSLPAICGELVRLKATGRLLLVRLTPTGFDLRELHVKRGLLTDVRSNAGILYAWELFARGFEADASAAVHLALARHQLATEHLSPAAKTSLRLVRTLTMRRHLEELFTWKNGLFGLDVRAAPSERRSEPLLPLLPRVVHRARSSGELREALDRMMDLPLERSKNFDSTVGQMALRPSDAARVETFGRGYTLVESLAQCGPGSEKPSMVLAHLLLELGLLKPAAAPQRLLLVRASSKSGAR